jgi:glycerol-3-phosphate dehydrogenase
VTRDLRRLSGARVDVAVVGGGIAGACIARDAARRGLSVALLEREDFASATTGASSKLLHGGLRYLRRLDLRVVRESLRERRIWADIAPNLVEPLPFLLPTTRRPSSHRAVFNAVLAAYDALAYDRNRVRDARHRLAPHRFLDRAAALALEPGLACLPITGAMLFHDYQMPSPERLALACVLDAAAHGAAIANHAPVVGLRLGGGRVTGVDVLDASGAHARVAVDAGLVVNATGPWADLLVAEWLEGPCVARLVRSKGIHLVTRPVGGPRAITVTGEHGHLFILPWRGLSLIGTTDTRFEGRPEECRVTEEDIRALLAVVNAAYPAAGLARADVRHAFAGLRPIVDRESRVEGQRTATGTYRASRAAEIVDHGAHGGPDGLLTVIGGKWTTARALAERVVDLACARLQRRTAPCTTASAPLPGAELLDRQADETRGFGERCYLARTFGTRAAEVLALTRREPRLAEPLAEDRPEPVAAAVFAIREEMASTLSDLVFRRLDLGGAGHPGARVIERLAGIAAAELGWSPARTRSEIDGLATHFVRRPDDEPAGARG